MQLSSKYHKTKVVKTGKNKV